MSEPVTNAEILRELGAVIHKIAVTDAETIRVLQMQIGSCQHCIGNHMTREHAPRCQAASDLIVKIKAAHQYCGSDCAVAAQQD